MKPYILTAALAAAVCTGSVTHAAPPASAETPARTGKPAIVLVHGAFADGSSWSKVIPLLEAKGYPVVAVQNPYISLAGDVAATDRVVNQQAGPVVLVGHSSGGTVITQAGNNPKVAALVFVDANAPDSGQSINELQAGLPAPAWAATLIKDEAGYLTLPRSTIVNNFAPDLSRNDRELIAATQVPWFSGYLDDKVTHAAWHDKPSWWVIGENDQMIDPKFQAVMAARMGAKITRVPTSHVAMLADPKAVSAVILAAAAEVRLGKIGTDPASGTEPASGSEPALSSRADEAASPPSPVVAVGSPAPTIAQTAREVQGPAGVVPLSDEPPVKLIIDPPVADSLAHGRVVIQYRAENLRIVPVFGPAALSVSPRIGHIHVTVDDELWHWLDASGEPLTITGLAAGPHQVLIELVNASHQTLDYGVIRFVVPYRFLTPNDPKADGFRSAPEPSSGSHRGSAPVPSQS